MMGFVKFNIILKITLIGDPELSNWKLLFLPIPLYASFSGSLHIGKKSIFVLSRNMLIA